jgi:hypothetical protein
MKIGADIIVFTKTNSTKSLLLRSKQIQQSLPDYIPGSYTIPSDEAKQDHLSLQHYIYPLS